MMPLVFAQVTTAVAISAAAVITMAAPKPSTDNDDRAAILAIIEHTIHPYVVRANGEATPVPPVFVFDRTTTICTDAPVFDYPCVDRSIFEWLRKGNRPAAQDIQSDSIWRELIAAFEDRNRSSHRIPRLAAKGVVMMSSADIVASRNDRHEPARGQCYFSSPAYSEQGYALVHGVYHCGPLCGTGWLFVLQKAVSGWRVIEASMVSIS